MMPVMPERTRQLLDFAEDMARERIHPGMNDLLPKITDDEWGLVFGSYRSWRDYLRARGRQGNRRALRLLRSMLTSEQREQLRRDRAFRQMVPSGNAYRLLPSAGITQRIEFHGTRWFGVGGYCLHPDLDLSIPNADTTIGHLLMLRHDEATFLTKANFTERRHGGWDPAWMRTRARVRREEYEAQIREGLRAEGVDPDAFLAELQAGAA